VGEYAETPELDTAAKRESLFTCRRHSACHTVRSAGLQPGVQLVDNPNLGVIGCARVRSDPHTDRELRALSSEHPAPTCLVQTAEETYTRWSLAVLQVSSRRV
jgi:hypothetical protein